VSFQTPERAYIEVFQRFFGHAFPRHHGNDVPPTRSLNTRVGIWMASTVFYSNSGIGVLRDRIYRRVSRHSLVHFRLKPYSRLIPNQQPRTGHHSPRNGQHLLLAARHGASLLLASFLEYREQLAHILDIFSNGFSTYLLLTHEMP
jgi:hypothetical protein